MDLSWFRPKISRHCEACCFLRGSQLCLQAPARGCQVGDLSAAAAEGRLASRFGHLCAYAGLCWCCCCLSQWPWSACAPCSCGPEWHCMLHAMLAGTCHQRGLEGLSSLFYHTTLIAAGHVVLLCLRYNSYNIFKVGLVTIHTHIACSCENEPQGPTLCSNMAEPSRQVAAAGPPWLCRHCA